MMLSLDDGVAMTPKGSGKPLRIVRSVKARCVRCNRVEVEHAGEKCRACVVELEDRRYAAYLAARQFRKWLAVAGFVVASAVLALVLIVFYT